MSRRLHFKMAGCAGVQMRRSRLTAFRYLAQWCVCAGVALGLASGARGQGQSRDEESHIVFDSIQSQVGQIFDRCRSAVVRIEATDDHGQLAGSGFFIDPNGTLYTSYTVGGESREIVVTQGELKYPARRVVADPRSGIAILQVEAKTPFLMIGSSHELKVASPVMTAGFPMDLALSPSFGVVGGFDRKYLGRYFVTTHIRANVPVQRGEGGAPLLNMRGEVIGILISSMDGGSATFALPIEAAEKVRRDYVRFGEVRPGWMGIEVRPAAVPVRGSTALVLETFAGAPAEAAGILPGDILLQIGTTPISSPEDVLDASFFATANDPLTVKLARGEEKREVTLHPSDPPGSQRTPTLGSGSSLQPGKSLTIGE